MPASQLRAVPSTTSFTSCRHCVEVDLDESNVSRVRIALVRARNAPADERVVRPLRAWNAPADEAHFVGSRDKAPISKAFGAPHLLR